MTYHACKKVCRTKAQATAITDTATNRTIRLSTGPPSVSMATLNSAPTPNPNSIKFTTEEGPFIDDGMLSIASEEDADDHPLGKPLIALSEVDNVFVLPGFLTITKQPAADWNLLIPKIEKIVSEYLEDKS